MLLREAEAISKLDAKIQLFADTEKKIRKSTKTFMRECSKHVTVERYVAYAVIVVAAGGRRLLMG